MPRQLNTDTEHQHPTLGVAVMAPDQTQIDITITIDLSAFPFRKLDFFSTPDGTFPEVIASIDTLTNSTTDISESTCNTPN